MRFLIVGCGYLGERVARAWLKDGHSVAAMTRSDETARRFEATGIVSIVGDITRPQSVANLPECDCVLHAVGFDRNAGPSFRNVYVDGLQNVLNVMRHRTQRFIAISSTSVYGQQNGEWIDEDSPAEPTRENGAIVLEAEQIIRDAFAAQKMNGTAHVLRLAGIYGPGRLLRRIDEVQKGTTISADPDGFLNLIHVDDAVQVVQAVANHPQPSKTYLVCDDRPVLRREYYNTLAQLFDAPMPKFDTSDLSNSKRGGRNKRCRNQRMKDDLGIELKYPDIKSGLAQALPPTIS